MESCGKHELGSGLQKLVADMGEESGKNEGITQERMESWNWNHTLAAFAEKDDGRNRFAQAAAFAVVEFLGTEYNPVYFYGDGTSEMTYLMHAIGNAVLEKYPDKKVTYVQGQKFLKKFVAAFYEEDVSAVTRLRETYSEADVLMIDGIQILADDPDVQDELFTIAEKVRAHGGQVVLSFVGKKEDAVLCESFQRSFPWCLMVEVQSSK